MVPKREELKAAYLKAMKAKRSAAMRRYRIHRLRQEANANAIAQQVGNAAAGAAVANQVPVVEDDEAAANDEAANDDANRMD